MILWRWSDPMLPIAAPCLCSRNESLLLMVTRSGCKRLSQHSTLSKSESERRRWNFCGTTWKKSTRIPREKETYTFPMASGRMWKCQQQKGYLVLTHLLRAPDELCFHCYSWDDAPAGIEKTQYVLELTAWQLVDFKPKLRCWKHFPQSRNEESDPCTLKHHLAYVHASYLFVCSWIQLIDRSKSWELPTLHIDMTEAWAQPLPWPQPSASPPSIVLRNENLDTTSAGLKSHHAEESHITQWNCEMEESHITRREVTSFCDNPNGTAAFNRKPKSNQI